MRRISHLVSLVVIALSSAVAIGAPLNKCVSNGSVTYQQGPCPSNLPRKDPTLQELNAAEKLRRASAASAAAASTAPVSATATASSPRPFTPPTTATSTGFSCDGRQYCSQMHSCAEAKYFLANCPGAKMDGNHDGVPCEQQWCSR